MLNNLNAFRKKAALVILYCCITGFAKVEICHTIYDVLSKKKTYPHIFYDYLFGFREDFDQITSQFLVSHANHSGMAYNLKKQSFHPVDLRDICITQYKALSYGAHGQIFLGKLLDENNKHTPENPLVFKFANPVPSNHLNSASSNYIAKDYRILEREVHIQKKIGEHPNILVFRDAYYFQPSGEHSEMALITFSMDKLEKPLEERTLEAYRSTHLPLYGLNEFYEGLSKDQITATQTAKYIAQTLSAYVHLLNKGLLNIDVHSINIMLDKSDNIKLIDFSLVNEYDLSNSEEIERLHKDFKDNITDILHCSFNLLRVATTATSDEKVFFKNIIGSLIMLKHDYITIQQRDETLRAAIESLEAFQYTNKTGQ